MTKKIAVALVTVLLVAACCLGLAACGDSDTSGANARTIVYIGDSIAEALIGPSPLAERENYGYYAVVGKINEMRYFNHSVSGHKTSTEAEGTNGELGGLLGMLYREDNGTLMKSHLEQADVIHISVLGNNILQYDLGLLMYEVAQPDFDDKFKEGGEGGTTLIDMLYRGSRKPALDDNGQPKLDKNGRTVYGPFDASDPLNYRYDFNTDGSRSTSVTQPFDFPPTYKDVIDIVARLRQLNPTAKIIFQTVYNPFFDGSKHLKTNIVNALANVKDEKGLFGEKGANITTIEQYRKIANKLLELLNNIIVKYKNEYKPENFYIMDVNAAFERVTQMDKDENGAAKLDEDCLGRQLIFTDWTHPSNFGHAIIACETQKLLEQFGYADKDALKNYKELRLEQLRRMYAGMEGVDDIASKIENAESMEDATLAYFIGVKGATPINYGGKAA